MIVYLECTNNNHAETVLEPSNQQLDSMVFQVELELIEEEKTLLLLIWCY